MVVEVILCIWLCCNLPILYSVNYLIFALKSLSGPVLATLYLGYLLLMVIVIMLATGGSWVPIFFLVCALLVFVSEVGLRSFGFEGGCLPKSSSSNGIGETDSHCNASFAFHLSSMSFPREYEIHNHPFNFRWTLYSQGLFQGSMLGWKHSWVVWISVGVGLWDHNRHAVGI